ncbi:MAG TPA: 1-(5-phosphoribosyl)-5-[(5-phosphoribosylamino)methylideneamino]imidazole-4-carboxamide isomerase [Firmicutes bacterium]|nr:1-(5-phosphoribosyl)-5-[(5-phosphoribosylamino)methylideneamino]imidazole-4-carboxamide isomerase [Bacillota bacterium]
MIIIPAIDIRGGKCVRLLQGRFEEETVFSHDPVRVAVGWQARGAQLLHVVDLDGARTGAPVNLPVIERLIREVTIPVQVGGGVRSTETARALFSMGVSRVILGSAALDDPSLISDLCMEFGDRILVSIDARDGLVATHGWQTTEQKPAVQLAREVKDLGVGEVVFTDITRDGALQGVNVEATLAIARAGVRVIASGGIASLEDVRRLAALEGEGIVGAIIGRALYTGDINFEEAVEAARRRPEKSGEFLRTNLERGHRRGC